MFLTLALAAHLAQVPAPAPSPGVPTSTGARAPASVQTLTLAQAVARARTTSPLRGSAEQLAAGATAAARLAGRPLNPLVEVRGENWTPGNDVRLPLDVFVVASQQFELGGKRGARRSLADADRDVAATSLAGVDRAVALRTIQLYLQALKSRASLDALTAHRDGLGTLTTTMRRRVAEGRSSESDLMRFVAESARTDIDVARAQLDLRRSLSALTYVIGASASLTEDQLAEPGPIDLPPVDAAALAQAASGHPDARLAQTRLDRARQASALERSRGVPDAIVTGGYKRTAGFDALVAGVALAVPLFDRNSSAVARAAGEEHAAAVEHDAILRRLTADTAALVDTARVLAQRSSRAAAELLEPATVVRSAALASFREGTSDVLKLIDAERVYADVRRTAIELRLDALAAVLEARLELGEERIP